MERRVLSARCSCALLDENDCRRKQYKLCADFRQTTSETRKVRGSRRRAAGAAASKERGLLTYPMTLASIVIGARLSRAVRCCCYPLSVSLSLSLFRCRLCFRLRLHSAWHPSCFLFSRPRPPFSDSFTNPHPWPVSSLLHGPAADDTPRR